MLEDANCLPGLEFWTGEGCHKGGGVIVNRPPFTAIIPLPLFCLLHICHVAFIAQGFSQVNMTSADQLQSLAEILQGDHDDTQVDVNQCDHSNSDKSDRSSDRGHKSDGDEAGDDEGDEDFDVGDSDSGSDKKRRRSCALCEATTKRAPSMPSTATVSRQPSVQSLINAMRDVYEELAPNEQLPNIKQCKSVMTRELANTALLCAMKDVLNEDVVQGGVISTEVVDMHQLVWGRLKSRHVTFITAHRFV